MDLGPSVVPYFARLFPNAIGTGQGNEMQIVCGR
jgi:hypothetical protein